MIHLQPRLFAALNIGGKGAVSAALRDALRLEFATIPVYLYAFYSLDRAKNRDIAGILRSVVIEEMLHMTLTCNIINALGDTPEIDDTAFIPSYPGPLPGGVESGLIVHLEPYSPAQLAVFLEIEEPETKLNFPVQEAAAAPPTTIGQFYKAIKTQISLLADRDFASGPRNQIDSTLVNNAIVVTDKQSAMSAIDLIVDQGEGTPQSPLEIVGPNFAHYYRFNQIAEKKKLIRNPMAGPNTPPDQQFIYGGDPIVFDPSGVHAAPRDPRASNYGAGTDARKAMDDFNAMYVDLLKSLQRGFGGVPAELDPAINEKMPELGAAARRLMTTAAPDGGTLGPSFEYVVGG